MTLSGRVKSRAAEETELMLRYALESGRCIYLTGGERMGMVMNKYELQIMEYILEQEGEFSESDIRDRFWEAGMTYIGETTIRILMERLVKRKILKRRIVLAGFFKWKFYYRSCFSSEFFQSHIGEMDPSQEDEETAWSIHVTRWKMALNPFILSEPVYCSSEEKERIRKLIDTLE